MPPSFNFARDVVARRAQEAPGAPALIAVDGQGHCERWTYGEVDAAVKSLAAAIHGSGLKHGDRVLILLPRIAAWHIAMTACLHLGLVPVPCVSQITAAEVTYRARRSGARGAITSRAHADKFAEIADGLKLKIAVGGKAGWLDYDEALATADAAPAAAEMPLETPALMYFTSGTSGNPKAVLHAARGLFVRGAQPWRQLGVTPADIIWATSDTGWTRAASCMLFGAWMQGATAFLYEGPTDTTARLNLLERYGVTVFCVVATELRLLLQNPAARRSFPRLRFTLTAGEVVTAELIARWREFTQAPVAVGYGQTETPTATLTDPSVTPANGMIGRSMDGNHVTVIDAAGSEAAAGIEGDIAFAADDAGLMLGFWADGRIEPGATRVGPDRTWYVTGDRGFREADGNIFFVGRDDDIISSAGYRIGPTEVENALMHHPAVLRCAVAATPDALRGEAVKAFVVLKDGVEGGEALVAALQNHVKVTIAPYKYPRQIQFVDALPLSGTGKVMRRTLREAEFRQAGTARAQAE
jgi:acetyl-CoA synthetase